MARRQGSKRQLPGTPRPDSTRLPTATTPYPTSRKEGYLLLRRQLSGPAPQSTWPEGVRLVPLAADDAAAIHHLLQQAYANGFGSVPENLLDWWEGLLTDSEFNRNLAFVAKAGGTIVGFCLCWTSSFVKDLVVDPAWRGKGIGAALLSTAINALRARGAEEVALKVDIYNATAQRLYRRFGFVLE